MTLYMVELTVAELPRSMAWYQAVCGLTAGLVDEPNGFAVMTSAPPFGSSGARPERGGKTPAAKLALKCGPPPTSGVRLHFLVPDLTAELARLAALSVTPESDLKTSPEGYRRAAFRDPDGHAVTLFEWVRPQLV